MIKSNRKIILLVEDEVLIAMAEKLELEKLGFDVLTAHSGDQAIEISINNKIDLILMDIDLGIGIDGTDTAEIILREKEIPIVFLSSHVEQEIVEKTEKIISYGYVVKNTGTTVLDASIKMAFKLFKANRAVSMRETEYRSTIDNLLIGVVVHASDSSILLCNPEATIILGLTEQQMSGKEVIDPAWNFLYEDLTPMRVEDYPVSKVISTKNSINDYVLGINRPDRDYITWVNVNAIPLFRKDDELDQIIVNFIDITKHRQIEKEVHKSEERFRTLFEQSTDCCFNLNLEGQILDINQSTLDTFGYSREEMLSLNITDSHPNTKEAQQVGHEAFKRLLANGSSHLEGEFIKKSGEVFYGEVVANIVDINNKRIVQGILRDITERKLKEKFLNKEKTYLELMLDNMPVMANVTNDKGNCILWNKECEKITGYTKDDVLGKSSKDILKLLYPDPDYLNSLLSEWEKRRSHFSHWEWELTCKDGSKKTISWSNISGIGDIQDISYWAVGVDVTERIQAKEALTDSEEKHRLFFENSPIGIIHYNMEGDITDVNKAMISTFGSSREKLIGLNIDNIPDKNFSKEVNKSLNGEPGYFEGIYISYTGEKNSYIKANWIPIKKENKVIAGVGIVEDISEKKAVEDSLLNEKILTEEYINSLPGLFYVFDKKRFIQWNKEWEIVSGYSTDELREKYATDFFNGTDKTLITEAIKKVFDEGNADVEANIYTKEGNQIPYYFTGLRKDFNGEPHLVGLGIDITDLKKTEEALEKALHKNTDLLKELQHRAKNSFSMIFSMIALAENSSKFIEVKSALSEIGSRVKAVSEMYDLLYSTESISEVQLEEYLNRISSSFHSISANITLKTMFDPIIVPVKTAIPIGLIIVELLTNSIKHAFPNDMDGTISLSVKKTDTRGLIYLSDNGIGLPKGFNVLSIDSMGLKIVHALATQIGGTLEIEETNGTHCAVEFLL